MAINLGMAFLTTVSVTKSTIPLTTMSLRSVSFSLISSQAAVGPPLISATTMSKPVSRSLHDRFAVGPERFNDFAANLRPGDAEHAHREFAQSPAD